MKESIQNKINKIQEVNKLSRKIQNIATHHKKWNEDMCGHITESESITKGHIIKETGGVVGSK